MTAADDFAPVCTKIDDITPIENTCDDWEEVK